MSETNGNANGKGDKSVIERISDKRQPVGHRMSSFRDLLAMKGKEIFDALPTMIPRERMVAVIMGNIRENPKLLDCHPVSTLSAVSQACTLGLSLDGPVGHAYLIPYKAECKLILGYKGLLHLALRSNRVLSIDDAVVRKGDEFTFQQGDNASIVHVPKRGTDAEITHVYAIFTLKGGGKVREVWTKDEIDKHKNQYAQGTGRKDSPWNTHWDKMAKKTVIRSILNSGKIPLSVEWLDLVAASDESIETQQQPAGVKEVSSLDDLADAFNVVDDESEGDVPPETVSVQADGDELF